MIRERERVKWALPHAIEKERDEEGGRRRIEREGSPWREESTDRLLSLLDLPVEMRVLEGLYVSESRFRIPLLLEHLLLSLK